jgi:hypothetical protein
MMPLIELPTEDGRLERYRMQGPRAWNGGGNGPHRFDRIALAAAHIIADPLADVDPWLTPAIDWDTTIAFRRHLWSLGLGVAEAMDTAQRGMGLDWTGAIELIQRSVAAARDVPGAIVFSGVGTDQVPPSPSVALDDVIRAYEDQIEAVEACGGRIVLMASRALVAAAKSPDDYAKVYGRILQQVKEPAIIHWLGEMFDPALAGYWGSANHLVAMDLCIDIIGDHADSIKLSLLDRDKEIRLRRRMPQDVLTYTGDDFNFPELIAGDAQVFPTRSLAFSTPSHRLRLLRSMRTAVATMTSIGKSSSRPSRCRGTSSKRRRASIRLVSFSWLTSAAISRISLWSVDSRALARCCISCRHSSLRTLLVSSSIRIWPLHG